MFINRKIKLLNKYYEIKVSTYKNNRICIRLQNKIEMHYITLDLKDQYLDDGCIFLDPLLINNGVIKELIKYKIIKEINCFINYNYVDIPVATYNIGVLRKYDNKGVMAHLKRKNNMRSKFINGK